MPWFKPVGLPVALGPGVLLLGQLPWNFVLPRHWSLLCVASKPAALPARIKSLNCCGPGSSHAVWPAPKRLVLLCVAGKPAALPKLIEPPNCCGPGSWGACLPAPKHCPFMVVKGLEVCLPAKPPKGPSPAVDHAVCLPRHCPVYGGSSLPVLPARKTPQMTIPGLAAPMPFASPGIGGLCVAGKPAVCPPAKPPKCFPAAPMPFASPGIVLLWWFKPAVCQPAKPPNASLQLPCRLPAPALSFYGGSSLPFASPQNPTSPIFKYIFDTPNTPTPPHPHPPTPRPHHVKLQAMAMMRRHNSWPWRGKLSSFRRSVPLIIPEFQNQ